MRDETFKDAVRGLLEAIETWQDTIQIKELNNLSNEMLMAGTGITRAAAVVKECLNNCGGDVA